MKSISEMSDTEFDKYLKTIKPHLPIWKQEGAKFLYREQGYQADRNNNAYHIWWVVWEDKKGKTHKSVERIRWDGKSNMSFDGRMWENLS